MIYQVIIYLVVAVALVGGSFYTGVRVANNACDAAQLKRVQEAEKARMVDESFTRGVSTAYEGVSQQLRRISAVNRVETTRETQRIEYRCPVPDTGIKLLNDAINNANTGTSKPDPVMPTPPPDKRKGDGGVVDLHD